MTTKNLDSVAVLESIAGGPLTFGRMLASIRLCDELSQVAFAKKLNISRQNMCDMEKGRASVSPARAARWARILGYSESFFVSLALQEAVNAAGLHLRVTVTDAPRSKGSREKKGRLR